MNNRLCQRPVLPLPFSYLGLSQLLRAPFRVVVTLWLSVVPLLTMATDYEYSTSNSTSTIERYTGPGGDVIIPDLLGGFPVAVVGDSAFASNSSLTSVTLPNSVLQIADRAFFICGNLTNITFGAGLERIGEFAFYYCDALKTLVLPDNMLGVETGAFLECYDLTNVVFGCSVTNIGDLAFQNCSSLKEVTFESGLANIGSGAFYNCDNIEDIHIPATVLRIGDSAFGHCNGLSSVRLEEGLLQIGNSAFNECSGLTRIAIPSSVVYVGSNALLNCASLTNVAVAVGNSAYSSVDGVLYDSGQTVLIRCPGGIGIAVTIPDSVETIRNEGFRNCWHLPSVTIGTGVVYIGSSAFRDCRNLTTISVPNSVGSFGDSAFESCLALETVSIGSGVTNVGGGTFRECGALNAVTFSGDAPEYQGTFVFLNANNATVWYHASTAGWGETYAGRPTMAIGTEWNLQIMGDSYFGIISNRFGFNVAGNSNLTFVVEFTTNLDGEVWIPLLTNVTDDGPAYFSDSDWTNSRSCFYRLRKP